MLRPAARQGHVVPALSHSLIAVATICDAGYTVEFDSAEVRILDKGTVVLTGHRHAPTRLWHLDIHPPQDPLQPVVHHANHIGNPTEADLVTFSHATLFSPTLSTLENALTRGYLPNLPGLSAESLRRNPPRSIATAKGHLDQVRKNLRSTKPTTLVPPEPDDPATLPDEERFPTQAPDRSHACFVQIFDPKEPTGQIFTDQTGRFIAPSTIGNNYLMILYDYDSNCILAQPFRNRTAKCILEAFKVLHKRLLDAGLRPKLHRLDNECSTILKSYLRESNIDFQLVPPNLHRRNAAERAIRTFKNHFIAGLCSTDPEFPIALWDELVPQSEITLNLLRGSRINPKLSAYAQLLGHFDFNRTPIGPPGCRVIAHVKPENRQSWSPHGLDGWYVGPAMDSYRCHRIWIHETRTTRVCDTVAWFPANVNMPKNSTNDAILASLRDIANALRRPSPRAPVAPVPDSLRDALRQITEILSNVADPLPTPPPPKPAPVPEAAPPLRVPTATPTPTDSAPPNIIPLDDPAPPAPPAADAPPPNLVPDEPPAPAPTPATIRFPDRLELPGLPDAPPAPTPTAPVPPTTYTDLTGQHNVAAKRRARRKKNTAKRQTRRPSQSAPTKRRNSRQSLPSAPSTRRSRRQTTPSRRAREAANAATADPLSALDAPMYQQYDHTHHLCCHGTALNPDTGQIAELQELLQSSEGTLWSEANDEEVGRMCTGLGPNTTVPEGTETLEFIHVSEMPKNKKATYVRIVCADRPEKPQPRRVRWTLGGDQIVYHGNKTTKTADLTTAKLLFNSVLSTPGAKFMTIDLKDFYLGTVLPDPEYVRIPVTVISPRLIQLYNLQNKIRNGFLYAKVKKGMYGLPHAGKLANDDLTQFLKPYGYVPCDVTPGLWKDLNSDLMFSLVVDDFGVRYTDKSAVERLLTSLQQKYKTSTDWTGSRYVGLTLKWDYENRTLDISMPGYIERALQRFSHPKPKRHESSPHPWTAPVYGSRQQWATRDETPFLDLQDKTKIQTVIGTFLYYGRAIDVTMLASLGTIASQQASPTETTMKSVVQFLNYAASNPDSTVRFYASDMQLHIESDASYLSESQARSRVAGYHYLSSHSKKIPAGTPPPRNGNISVPCKIIRNVLASAAEAELAGLFVNGQDAIPERITLEELGHPQEATPIVTDNATATGIANNSIKQKRSKAMDMRFFWIRDQVRQGHFAVYWRAGKSNLADYFTKHHSGKHHRRMRPFYLQTPDSNRVAPLSTPD